jgi:hypothetical protein
VNVTDGRSDVTSWNATSADVVVGLDACRVVGLVQILLDLRLAVRHEGAVRVPADVEVEELLAAVRDAGLGVHVTFGVHSLAEPWRRSSSTVPHSSTPARMRESTCSRLWRSIMMESMPAWCRMSDNSDPAGPAPTIATRVHEQYSLPC